MEYHVNRYRALSCHIISCHSTQVVPHNVMSYHVVSCDVMSCYVVTRSCSAPLCRAISCDVMFFHVMTWHVISCHTISQHVFACNPVSCYFFNYIFSRCVRSRWTMSCSIPSLHVVPGHGTSLFVFDLSRKQHLSPQLDHSTAPNNQTKPQAHQDWRPDIVSPWTGYHTGGSWQDTHCTQVPERGGCGWLSLNHKIGRPSQTRSFSRLGLQRVYMSLASCARRPANCSTIQN